MWAIRMVLKPKDIPKAIKASIREIPVTMSALSIGILVIPITIALCIGFMVLMAMQAATPITVAIRAERKAISSSLIWR